jgi:hypothetical protein
VDQRRRQGRRQGHLAHARGPYIIHLIADLINCSSRISHRSLFGSLYIASLTLTSCLVQVFWYVMHE